MKTFNTLLASVATLALLAPLLFWSCSDPVQTASYPILLKPKRVENTSALKSVVPDGDQWKEVEPSSVGLDITNRIDFAAQVFDEEVEIELIADNQWRVANDTIVFPFERGGDNYEFLDTLHSVYYFTKGNNSQMRMKMISAIVQGKDQDGTPRSSIYRYSHSPDSSFDLLYPLQHFESSDTLIIEQVYYKTFDMVYTRG